MEIAHVHFTINDLSRTIRIKAYDWGVNAVIEDKRIGQTRGKFYQRNFKLTASYPTIESNIQRALKHFNSPEEAMPYILKLYESNKTRDKACFEA